jgi:hypothetical protein
MKRGLSNLLDQDQLHDPALGLDDCTQVGSLGQTDRKWDDLVRLGFGQIAHMLGDQSQESEIALLADGGLQAIFTAVISISLQTILIIGSVVDQDNARAETIFAGGRLEQQAEVNHRNDVPAVTEQTGQARRRVRNFPQLDPGDDLDNSRDIDGISIRAGCEGQEQHAITTGLEFSGSKSGG